METKRDRLMKDHILICGSTSFFPDDVPGECYACRKAIYARPHNAAHFRWSCTRCATKRISLEGGTPELRITPDTIRDVNRYFNVRKN